MMTLINLVISSLAGIALHQTRRYTHSLPEGWRELTSYTIGVTGTTPIFALWWHRLKDVTHPFERAFLAFVLAFIGVGTGVSAGWLVDTFKEEFQTKGKENE